MTSFENMLIGKGYKRYILNYKTMKYEYPKRYSLSTMGNLDHRYIHETDEVLLKKIKQGKIVMDDITWEDRKGVIGFGLHESGKPPTLIFPRPKIKVIKESELYGVKQLVVEDESFDNSMNLVLSKVNNEQIFKALYNDSIVFEFDLTKQSLKN